MKTNLREQLTR